MPNLAPEVAAQLGTAILVAISQQITPKQCRHIAYLMSIGYGRKESLSQIKKLLQQLNQDASDLVSQAATNTANMSLESMTLTDDGTDTDSDSSSTNSDDDVPLQHKRKSEPYSSKSAGKRRRLTSVSSADDVAINYSSPSPSVIRRQPGVTVEVPRLKRKMAIYDLPISPLQCRSESIAGSTHRSSVELGLEYTLPESGQRQVIPYEDQPYIPTSPIIGGGGFALQSPFSELECLSKDDHDSESDGDRASSKYHDAESNIPPSKAELTTKERLKLAGDSVEDSIYIKSESESGDVNFAIKEAKRRAKNPGKRQRQKAKEKRALADKSGPIRAGDAAGSKSCPSLSNQPIHQPPKSLPTAQTKDTFPGPNPSTPRQNGPKIKREKSTSASPRKTPSQKDRGVKYCVNKSVKRQKIGVEEKPQLPTPPGWTPSDTVLLSQPKQRKPTHQPPSDPKRWRDQQAQVQAALSRDKQVRASAPGPSFMETQIGITEDITGCGDDVMDLTDNHEPLSPGESSGLPEPMLTFRCDRSPSRHQQTQHTEQAKESPEATPHQRKGQHKVRTCPSPPQRSLPHRTVPTYNTNATRSETTFRADPPPSLPLPCQLQEPTWCPPKSPRFKNCPERASDHSKPLVPNFNQRMIAVRERHVLPNPGRRNWLPIPSLRQSTPAEWHRLGQTSATNAYVKPPGAKLPISKSVVETRSSRHDAQPLHKAGPSISQTEVKQRSQQSLGSVQPHITNSSGRSDPRWAVNSRSPSVESSYLLWGSIRMKTTWKDDENTIVDAYSESEVSDGLEIVNIPRPRRWALSTVGQMDVADARGEGKGRSLFCPEKWDVSWN
ncbi:hypothetical protein H2200_010732 [Cladophialophora chaetospira]|uniref:Uncharacterized protein n=1 Tax=Cladophialophora chaetospira TaxID=386627 RepID=A0AA38X0Q6_9EURO|nr:hypothetical protein H2200_010732 [Cladophialophora chaetospira]